MTVSVTSVDSPVWIVVADNATAEFCIQPSKSGRVDRMFTLESDAARSKTEDIISDRGGRSFDSHGQGRHTLSPRHEPKEVESLKFARKIAKRLVEIENGEPVSGIILIAAPRFLGMLRKAIDIAGGMTPCRTIDKDVVGQDERFLEQLLAAE